MLARAIKEEKEKVEEQEEEEKKKEEKEKDKKKERRKKGESEKGPPRVQGRERNGLSDSLGFFNKKEQE